ncbi:Uncharacterised protein [Vibrio cholerae]|nr:Uncharacterised protein [Vibrio cholerae]
MPGVSQHFSFYQLNLPKQQCPMYYLHLLHHLRRFRYQASKDQPYP